MCWVFISTCITKAVVCTILFVGLCMCWVFISTCITKAGVCTILFVG